MTEKAYKVINEKGLTICESDDIFHPLSVIKRQPPGAKLIRTSDGKTLAYTTTLKDFDLDEQPRRRRRKLPT